MKTKQLTQKMLAKRFAFLRNSLAPFVDDGRAALYLSQDGSPSILSHPSSFRGVIANVHHGVTQSWNIPVLVDGGELFHCLTSLKTVELLRRVARGYSCEWTGRNYVGVLDDDAGDAHAELQDALKALRCWGAVNASEALCYPSALECFGNCQTFDEVVAAAVRRAHENMKCVVLDEENVGAVLLDLVLADYRRGIAPTGLMRSSLAQQGNPEQLALLARLDAEADAGNKT